MGNSYVLCTSFNSFKILTLLNLFELCSHYRLVKEDLHSITQSWQTFLLCMGTKRSCITSYFIVVDKHALPCKATCSIGAFNELFKAHVVFGTSCYKALLNLYTFIQTTVYKIDAGKFQSSRTEEGQFFFHLT